MMITKKEQGYPVLLSYPHGTTRQKVWCPYCGAWHIHSKGNGHRVAHCTSKQSPFRTTGYIIKIGTQKDYKIKRA